MTLSFMSDLDDVSMNVVGLSFSGTTTFSAIFLTDTTISYARGGGVGLIGWMGGWIAQLVDINDCDL